MKKKYFIFYTLLFIIQVGFSQTDTIIYRRANNKPAVRSNATEYIKIKKHKRRDEFTINRYTKDENQWKLSSKKETAYKINDSTLKIIIEYKNKNKTETIRVFSKEEDLFYFQDYYENKQIKKEGLTKTVLSLHLEGAIKKYFKSGNLSSIEEYKDNQMLSNENWLENGDKYLDNVFTSVDEMPEYPGGIGVFLAYIGKNLVYPVNERDKGIEGRVYIHFVVDEEGRLVGTYIIKGINKNLDLAALEVIESSPAIWVPGILDGNNVKVGFNIPIRFSLR